MSGRLASQCICPCHAPGRFLMHFTECCHPDPGLSDAEIEASRDVLRAQRRDERGALLKASIEAGRMKRERAEQFRGEVLGSALQSCQRQTVDYESIFERGPVPPQQGPIQVMLPIPEGVNPKYRLRTEARQAQAARARYVPKKDQAAVRASRMEARRQYSAGRRYTVHFDRIIAPVVRQLFIDTMTNPSKATLDAIQAGLALMDPSTYQAVTKARPE